MEVSQRDYVKQSENLSPELTNQITQLNLEKLENLGEMLLDFSNLDDLKQWLRNNNH